MTRSMIWFLVCNRVVRVWVLCAKSDLAVFTNTEVWDG